MATFYTGVDKERYDAGNQYVPMDRFLLNYQTPTTDVKEVETSYGIPNTNAFLGGGGGENNTPLTYNQNYNPFPYRQASERSFVGAPDELGYSTDTEAMKMMEMYPEYYNTNPKASLGEGIVNALPFIGTFSRLMKNQIGPYLPVNRRSILENEILRDGVMVDDIGRIVQGKGDYNTAENVMAGYNAAAMSADTFDKRISRIQETLEKKYGSADYTGDKTKLDERLAAIQEAKQNWLDAQGRTDLIAEDEEDQKEKQKQKTLISKLFTKKGVQDVTAPGDDGSGDVPIVNTTSGDNTSPGDGGSPSTFAGDSGAAPGTTGSWSPGGTYEAPRQHHALADGGRIGLYEGGGADARYMHIQPKFLTMKGISEDPSLKWGGFGWKPHDKFYDTKGKFLNPLYYLEKLLERKNKKADGGRIHLNYGGLASIL